MTKEQLIHVRREMFGESREAFAEATGVGARTLGRYERGESPIPKVLGLAIAARLYGLPPWGEGKINECP